MASMERREAGERSGGERSSSARGQIATVDPSSGETVRVFQALEPAQVDERLARASRAAVAWRRTPLAERLAVLERAASILEDESDRFARLMALEMGKLVGAGQDEARKCAAACRYYVENAERMLAPELVDADGGTRDRILFQPLGVVLAVMPWNFPFWQVVRFAAPALAAGNVGVLKHASNVPQCALALDDLFHRAGAPDGVFQSLLVGSRAVAEIIADPRVAAVTITGSDAAGRQVASAAGQHLKKVVLELGGSDPFIVLPSADLQAAVKMAIKARIINSGQSCIAAKRFIVAEPVFDRFMEAFVTGFRALRVGAPTAPETELGPLATAAILEALADQVRRSVSAGARLVTGGARLDRPGNYYAPTVLTDIPREAPAYHEELFGPVASVFRARDLDEAIRLANDTAFGLGASAWTRDPAEAERLAVELEAGTVCLNRMVASDPRLPFGGIKQSGFGRELGIQGLREFVNVKTVRG